MPQANDVPDEESQLINLKKTAAMHAKVYQCADKLMISKLATHASERLVDLVKGAPLHSRLAEVIGYAYESISSMDSSIRAQLTLYALSILKSVSWENVVEPRHSDSRTSNCSHSQRLHD